MNVDKMTERVGDALADVRQRGGVERIAVERIGPMAAKAIDELCPSRRHLLDRRPRRIGIAGAQLVERAPQRDRGLLDRRIEIGELARPTGTDGAEDYKR